MPALRAQTLLPAVLRWFVLLTACTCLVPAAAQSTLERGRLLLQQGNPKQAYVELSKEQATRAGDPEFDYLLGVAALDSGKNDEAVIAFERVLAKQPKNAGAQMDLARAYFAAGSFELAEASFNRLKQSNPPQAALATIDRYLDAIRERKQQNRPGYAGYIDLSLGRDSNLTGVPRDFSGAIFEAFQIPGIEPTGNSIKRSANYFNAQGGIEYARPISRGFSLFAGGDARYRAHQKERDFNVLQADARAGAMWNQGAMQWRGAAFYQHYDQEAAAPSNAGETKPTNDRRTTGGAVDFRYSITHRTQVGAGLQYAQVRFPTNEFEDFNQTLGSISLLRSFESQRVPYFLVSAFLSNDEAVRKLPDGITDKGKRVTGVRAFSQFTVTQKTALFLQLAYSERKDTSDFARANSVQSGRDKLGDATFGVSWRFSPQCQVRTQAALSRNDSNIPIYDYSRAEVSTAVRCETN